MFNIYYQQAKREKRESVTVATNSEPESEAPAESGVEDEPALEVTKGHVEFNPDVLVDEQQEAPPNVKVLKCCNASNFMNLQEFEPKSSL